MTDGQRSPRDRLSAGILAYRHAQHGLEVLLVHPGGPFWRNKDDGAWSIPKGEIDQSEDPELAARREFGEELGPAASMVCCSRWARSGSVAAIAWLRFMVKENSIRQGSPATRLIRVAAPQRTLPNFSGGRPRRVVRSQDCEGKNFVRADRAHR